MIHRAAKVPKRIEALLLRFFIAIIGLTVPFVLLQPLIWRVLFDEQPPSSATDLGNVISVLITLFTFALAAYGFVTYRFIKDQLNKELSKKLTLRLNEKLEPAFSKMHALSARNALSLSLREWRRYENDLWRDKHHYAPEFEKEEAFQRRLELAIEYGTDALEDIRQIKAAESYEILRLQYEVVKNLAYQFATRRSIYDLQNAMELTNELINDLIPKVSERELGEDLPSDPYTWGEEIEYLMFWLHQDAFETIIWTYLRFELTYPNDINALRNSEIARSLLEQLFASGALEPDRQRQYQEKYYRLFALDYKPQESVFEENIEQMSDHKPDKGFKAD